MPSELEDAAWEGIARGMCGDHAWRTSVLSHEAQQLPLDALRMRLAMGFNLPPSQYQLHLQAILPPLMPHHLALLRKGVHFQAGRFLPAAYVRKALAKLTAPLPGAAGGDMSAAEQFVAVEAATGVSYEVEHAAFLASLEAANAELAAYRMEDFEFAQRDGEVRRLRARGEEGPLPTAADLQKADTQVLQGYGRVPMRFYSYAKPLGPLPPLGQSS